MGILPSHPKQTLFELPRHPVPDQGPSDKEQAVILSSKTGPSQNTWYFPVVQTHRSI